MIMILLLQNIKEHSHFGLSGSDLFEKPFLGYVRKFYFWLKNHLKIQGSGYCDPVPAIFFRQVIPW